MKTLEEIFPKAQQIQIQKLNHVQALYTLRGTCFIIKGWLEYLFNQIGNFVNKLNGGTTITWIINTATEEWLIKEAEKSKKEARDSQKEDTIFWNNVRTRIVRMLTTSNTFKSLFHDDNWQFWTVSINNNKIIEDVWNMGVAAPAQLIIDIASMPYNVGKAIFQGKDISNVMKTLLLQPFICAQHLYDLIVLPVIDISSKIIVFDCSTIKFCNTMLSYIQVFINQESQQQEILTKIQDQIFKITHAYNTSLNNFLPKDDTISGTCDRLLFWNGQKLEVIPLDLEDGLIIIDNKKNISTIPIENQNISNNFIS